LEKITGQDIRETDFTDDRLTLLLKKMSDVTSWQSIETELGQRAIRVYDLKQKTVRLDATTVSGHHDDGEASLFQFGNSKDNPRSDR